MAVTSARQRALLKRLKRLVELVAGNHKVHADNVFDLARMMRLPGRSNNKAVDGEAPPLVTAPPQPGGPLDDGRGRRSGSPRSAFPSATTTARRLTGWCRRRRWTSGDHTCGYVTKMVNGWATDRPKPGGGRNPFVYNQHIRLFCALRLGCITADDYQTRPAGPGRPADRTCDDHRAGRGVKRLRSPT